MNFKTLKSEALYANKNRLLTYNAIFRKCKTRLSSRDSRRHLIRYVRVRVKRSEGPWRPSEVEPPFRYPGNRCSFKAADQWRGASIVLGQESHDQGLSSTQKLMSGAGVGRSCRGVRGRNGRLKESQRKSNGKRSHHGEAPTLCLFRGR